MLIIVERNAQIHKHAKAHDGWLTWEPARERKSHAGLEIVVVVVVVVLLLRNKTQIPELRFFCIRIEFKTSRTSGGTWCCSASSCFFRNSALTRITISSFWHVAPRRANEFQFLVSIAVPSGCSQLTAFLLLVLFLFSFPVKMAMTHRVCLCVQSLKPSVSFMCARACPCTFPPFSPRRPSHTLAPFQEARVF